MVRKINNNMKAKTNTTQSRTKRIELVVSPYEKVIISEAANRLSLSISQFIRDVVISKARFENQKPIPQTTKLGT